MPDAEILTRRGRNSTRERQRLTPRPRASGETFRLPTPAVSAMGWRPEGTESIEIYRQLVSPPKCRAGAAIILLSLASATGGLQLVRCQLTLSNPFPKNLTQRA